MGRALQALRTVPGLTREMLFISTKSGFMNETLLAALLHKGRIKQTDVLSGSHCIHPTCLEASLERSLKAMNIGTVSWSVHMETGSPISRGYDMQACISGMKACDNPRLSQVDLLYLHNVAEMQPDAVALPAFHKKLAAAFKFFEQKRKQGQIKAYGMATWTCFRSKPEEQAFLALQKVVELAEEVGGKDHGFRHAPDIVPIALSNVDHSVQAHCGVVSLTQVHPAAHKRWHDGSSAEALAARHLRG